MIQMIDVRHEVVMIAFQIIPNPLPVKEIGKKTGDQKKRKRIEYIPRSNCGRLDHVRADIEDQHVGELERDDAILFTFILHHGTALL